METSVVEKLLAAQSGWESSVGAAYPGNGAEFRGYDMLEEFKHWNWLSTFYFATSGRKLSSNAEKFINAVYCMCFSYPDVRIWNNGIAAMAASTRSTAQLGICGGNAISEANFYGGRPVMKAVDFILRAKEKFESGSSMQEIYTEEKSRRKYIYGYGRPIVSHDERVPPAISLMKELGLFDRSHVRFATEFDDYLQTQDSEIRLNICGVFAAFCADEGMEPREAYYLLVVCYSIGMLACYVDALDKPEGHLFPFRCDSIRYSGNQVRDW